MTEIQRRDWRLEGVKVIKSDRLDSNTAQTPGMLRAAAVNSARGAQKIWAGTVIIHPNAKTGAHHHGALESVIYVVRGVARMRWGERLEFVAEADAGDFIFVPPYVPHQEINRSSDTPLECVLVRSDNEAVVVNLNIDAAERVEEVYWIDPIHRGVKNIAQRNNAKDNAYSVRRFSDLAPQILEKFLELGFARRHQRPAGGGEHSAPGPLSDCPRAF